MTEVLYFELAVMRLMSLFDVHGGERELATC